MNEEVDFANMVWTLVKSGAITLGTYYSILGLACDAEPEVIAAAYRSMAKKYHPDTNQSQHAESRIKALNEAYAVLSDPDLRCSYDALLAVGENEALSQTRREDQDASSESSSASTTASIVGEDKGVTSRRQVAETSVMGDIVFLLFGVPVMWVITMFVADLLFAWTGTVFLDWLSASSYSFGDASHSFVEIARAHYHQIADEGPAYDAASISIVVMAFGALWLFFCSAVATGSVLGFGRDERPRLPTWSVAVTILILFAAIATRKVQSINENASLDYTVNIYVTLAAVLAGILFAMRSQHKEDARRRAVTV